MAVSRKDVLTYLEESNMVEISELISEIEEKFGVSAAAPVAVAAATSAGVEEGESKKTEFNVILKLLSGLLRRSPDFALKIPDLASNIFFDF